MAYMFLMGQVIVFASIILTVVTSLLPFLFAIAQIVEEAVNLVNAVRHPNL